MAISSLVLFDSGLMVTNAQELRVRPFFTPAAVFAVPIAGIIMQMAGPSVAWLCLFCRKAQGGILQAAHRVHVFNPRASAYARARKQNREDSMWRAKPAACRQLRSFGGLARPLSFVTKIRLSRAEAWPGHLTLSFRFASSGSYLSQKTGRPTMPLEHHLLRLTAT
jgi:hypothetical protein